MDPEIELKILTFNGPCLSYITKTVYNIEQEVGNLKVHLICRVDVYDRSNR